MSSRSLTARPVSGVRLGFYGKIPARGDFVRHGLSRALVAAWDRWAQAVLAELSRQDGWTAAWDAAPACRLALDAGLCGPAPLIGAMVASRDRTGRRFPLLCAAEGMAEVRACAGLIDALDRIGQEAVEAGSPPEDLRAALAALNTPAAPSTALGQGCGRWWRSDAAREITLSAMPDAVALSQLLVA